MRYFNMIRLVVFLLLVSNSQKSYAQDGWENAIDTIKIEEAQVVDSAILTLLDSAFTFLRLPPLEFGAYNYVLSFIRKEEYPVGRVYFNIALFVDEYMSKELDVDNYSPNTYGKLLLNYKGKQIRIGYNVDINDTLALQYFKPAGTKAEFYHYLKISKELPNAVFIPKRKIMQSVWFSGRKYRVRFQKYELRIFDETVLH